MTPSPTVDSVKFSSRSWHSESAGCRGIFLDVQALANDYAGRVGRQHGDPDLDLHRVSVLIR